MFSYFGSKFRLAKYYPYPKYDKIIEPFCGSAKYSLHANNWQKQVVLCDFNENIVLIWKYLINATVKDIMSLPILKEKDHLDNYNLSTGERLLIGFYINQGATTPKYKVGKWSYWNDNIRYRIARNIYKVKHWKIKHCSYDKLENYKATWFIDPPYQYCTVKYPKQFALSYLSLAKWCRTRNGQMIVCENSKANWMNFKPIKKRFSVNSYRRKHNCKQGYSIECMWTNDNQKKT